MGEEENLDEGPRDYDFTSVYQGQYAEGFEDGFGTLTDSDSFR
jgi:hypothetical protein